MAYISFRKQMSKHNDLGVKGEKIAQSYLKNNNYLILETNWRHGRAEIDIICKKEGILVFVEVKTRTSDYFGKPEEFVTKKKERLMFHAANEYMELVNHLWEIRFDIISILIDNSGNVDLNHFEDAFFP